MHMYGIIHHRYFIKKYLILCRNKVFYEKLSKKCFYITERRSFKNFPMIYVKK